MCHKEKSDGADYEACRIRPDRDNPVLLPDTSVIAIVCVDVDSPRCDKLASEAVKSEKGHHIACIPASMYSVNWFGGVSIDNPLSFLRGHYGSNGHIVLANSNPGGLGSFVTDAAGVVRVQVKGDERLHNQIGLFPVIVGAPQSLVSPASAETDPTT